MLDLFIHHPKQPGCLFNVQTSVLKGHLLFKVTALKWNEAEQENDEIDLPEMTVEPFAKWLTDRHNEGWRAQPNGA